MQPKPRKYNRALISMLKLSESIKTTKLSSDDVVANLKRMRHIGQNTEQGKLLFVGWYTERAVEHMLADNFSGVVEALNELYIRILEEHIK